MDNRFAMLMSLVSYRTLSDIGCDHALIDISLVENDVCDRIIASDLRIGPLAAAKKNIACHHLDNKIETRLSDGLQKFVPGETESILISGMGGRLIMRILERSFDIVASAKELILSPQSEIPEFEIWLRSHNFKISKKVICKEADKFYFGYLVHYAEEPADTFRTDNTGNADNADNNDMAAGAHIPPAVPYTSRYMLPAIPEGLYLQYLTREKARYLGALRAYSESYKKVRAKYRSKNPGENPCKNPCKNPCENPCETLAKISSKAPNEYTSKNSAESSDDLSPDIILQNKIKEIQYEINRLK